MMKKILGILVCTLLIITALSATGATNFHTSVYIKEKKDLEPYPSNPTKSPDIITIKIEAQVTGVQDPNNLLEGKILVNDSITGKYNYDSGTPDSNPEPNIGKYEYNSSNFGIELEVGGFVFKTNPNNVNYSIAIVDGLHQYYNWDLYSLVSSNNSQLSNGVPVDGIELALIDTTGNALASDALPTTALNLSDWEENLLLIYYISSPPYDMYLIMANVTKVTLSRSKTRDIHFTTHPILIWLFERFPNLLPIIKHIIRFQ